MNEKKPSRTRLLGLALVAAALFASCGSGTDESQAVSDDVSTESTADDASTETAADDASTEAESTDADTETDGEAADGAGTEVESGSSTEALVESDYLGSYTLVNEAFGTEVTVTVSGDTRTIETNALPDHETGDFPNGGNPNTISAQDLTWEFTTSPTYIGNAAFARTSGVALNGVKFEPATAESVQCDTGENYRIEAIQEVYDLGLDFNNAHVQPTGEYHYHGISELLVEGYESDEDLVLVGFASDGYLMYYSKSGAYQSSYSMSTETRTGTGCVVSGPGGDTLDLEGTAPDGAYTSDWVFDASTGDLDSCNGVTIDGQYAYIITDAYPYVSRCLNGEASPDAGGGGGGGGGGGAPGGERNATAPGGGGGGVDLTEAAETLGISVEELMAALGGPPPDLEAAAETLGVTVEELTAILPTPDQGGNRPTPGG